MDKLYYISQGSSTNEQLNNLTLVLDAGVQLVQFRMKNVSEELFKVTAYKVKALCDSYKVKCIVNDNVLVAKEINASGVHLGKQDISPKKARLILGNEKLIGGTANTFEDCESLYHQGVNYIGLGPYKYTTTKQNLSPILGVQGYSNITEQLKQHHYSVPIYAIGGIEISDIKDLMNCGVYGVALSSFISNKNKDTIKKNVDMLKLSVTTETTYEKFNHSR